MNFRFGFCWEDSFGFLFVEKSKMIWGFDVLSFVGKGGFFVNKMV